MPYKIPCLALLALVLASPSGAALSETASVSPTASVLLAHVHGKVFKLGSPDPLEGALAQVQGSTLSAETGADGAFSLELPPGSQVLHFSAAGFAPADKKVQLQAGQDLRLKAYLSQVDFTSDEVVVTGHKEWAQVVTSTLTQSEIKRIPGTGGDALRAVQNLPGVAVISDFSTQLAVQGGGPNDNLYLLDNIPWPFPFHFGGIVSTVNSDLLESVDLNSAGFSARWGNNLGAVLDAKTRTPKKDRIHVSADISLILTQVLVEGPLGLGDASFSLAGRRSYLELVIGILNSRRSSSSSKSSSASITEVPAFWDLGGSVDFSLGPDNHFRILALANDDVLGVDVPADQASNPAFSGHFSVDNNAVTSGLSWTNTSLPNFRSTLSPYYYQVGISDDLGTAFDINSHSNVYGVKEEAVLGLGENNEAGFGLSEEIDDASNLIFIFNRNFNNPTLSQAPVATTVTGQSKTSAAYVQDRQKLGPLALTVGMHYAKNDLVADDQVDPRLSLEWKQSDSLTWKAAWGVYDQFPGTFQLNPDLGNPQLGANRAQHTVLAVEDKVSSQLTARIDAYYKDLSNLVVSNAPSPSDNNGSGDVKGFEVFLKEDMGQRFFGWLSYALSKSERLGQPPADWNLYEYDQTSILTMVASYKFKPTWGMGIKAHYNTGPLVQSFQGYYPGTTTPMTSATYDQRLGDYLRLDLRGEHSWLYQGWNLNLYVEILNLLDRENPDSLSYPHDGSGVVEVNNNLGRLPYFGLEATF